MSLFQFAIRFLQTARSGLFLLRDSIILGPRLLQLVLQLIHFVLQFFGGFLDGRLRRREMERGSAGGTDARVSLLRGGTRPTLGSAGPDLSGRTGALEEAGGGAGGRDQVLLRSELALDPHNIFPDLCGCGIRRWPAANPACVLRNSSSKLPANRNLASAALELIIVLEFFALLRGHVGLEKDSLGSSD